MLLNAKNANQTSQLLIRIILNKYLELLLPIYIIITWILLKIRICPQDISMQRKYLSMIIRIWLFIPPCTCTEFIPSDQVSTSSTLAKELTPPFIQ